MPELHLPGAGELHLRGQRVLVTHVQALGQLRHDLIVTLGLARARGFLLRYGWTCGYNDAAATEPFRPPDTLEWLALGHRLHSAEGVAEGEALRRELDPASGAYYVEGLWRNSYEAREHVRRHGRPDQPTCWTLVGYAGGWASRCLGRRVLFKEVECEGQGDPHCRYIGRSEADWGDALGPEWRDYQEERLGEALDDALARIERQNAQLRRLLATHERLTRMVLDGRDLGALAAALGQSLGLGVLIADRWHRPVASYAPPQPPESEGSRVGTAAPAPLSPDALGVPHIEQRLAALVQDKRPTLLPADPTLGIERSRWLAPVLVGSDYLGYVAVDWPAAGLSEADQAAIEQATTACALVWMKERTAAEVETRLRADLAADLTAGRIDDPQALERRARVLGLDLPAPYLLLVAAPDDPGPAPSDLLAAAAAVLRQSLPGCALAARGQHLVILAPCVPGTPDAALAEQVGAAVRRARPGVSLSFVVGGRCQGPAAYRPAYARAEQALAVLRLLGGRDRLVTADQLGLHGWLLGRENAEQVVAAARATLAPIAAYDAAHDAELLATLRAYLESGGHVKAAATRCALHPSALKYRLRRVAELAGLDLNDPETRFTLQLALKIEALATALGGTTTNGA